MEQNKQLSVKCQLIGIQIIYKMIWVFSFVWITDWPDYTDFTDFKIYRFQLFVFKIRVIR